jgi:hypothetical protein
VRARLVEPGYGPDTRLARNSGSRLESLIPELCQSFAQPMLAAFTARPTAVTTESDVADAIWRAATDAAGPLHYSAGPDAVALARPA